MRPFFVLVIVLVLFPVLDLLAPAVMAQSVCRESRGYAVERQFGLVIQSVSLTSPSGSFHARAVIPASGKTLNPVVFSFSTLLGSGPKQVVDMMPAALQLARRNMAVVVIERALTWPAISTSVGKMQETVLCAEQWLSAHADVRPDHWTFVGPDADVPTFDQLHALPDTTSMTFFWDIPVGGPGEGKETEGILRESSYVFDAMLNRSVGIP